MSRRAGSPARRTAPRAHDGAPWWRPGPSGPATWDGEPPMRLAVPAHPYARPRGVPLERDMVSDEEWERAMGREIEHAFGPDDEGYESRAD